LKVKGKKRKREDWPPRHRDTEKKVIMVLREEKAENTEKDKEGNLALVKKEKCCSLCLGGRPGSCWGIRCYVNPQTLA